MYIQIQICNFFVNCPAVLYVKLKPFSTSFKHYLAFLYRAVVSEIEGMPFSQNIFLQTDFNKILFVSSSHLFL